MDFPQLNHLKVADLKQHLKQRGLPIVGNKSDLIQRLGTALLQEAQSPALAAAQAAQAQAFALQIQQQQQQQQSSAKIHQEIDEDAILGDDDEDDSSSMPISGLKHSVDSLIQNEDLLLSETSLSNPSTASNMIKTTSKPKIQPSASISSTIDKSHISSATTKTSNNASSTASTTNVDNTSTTNVSSNNTTNTLPKSAVPSLKQLIKNKHSLTSEERKRLRSLKFADPKLMNRAERFGVAAKVSEPSEEGKLLQRAQRFGEVVSSKAKTLDEKERLERRKERFGSTSGATNKTPITFNKGPVPENIKKRQERFGIVEKPTAVTVGGGSFKRKRFAS